jgi:hypothetical protein
LPRIKLNIPIIFIHSCNIIFMNFSRHQCCKNQKV